MTNTFPNMIRMNLLLAELRAGRPPALLAGYVDRCLLAVRIAELVAAEHARDHHHGNLRPDCILVGDHGQVAIDGWDQAAPVDDPHLAAYAAPERLLGQPPSAASDIYSLGSILWEMLTQKPPLMVEENLTRFWRRKRGGEVDPLPAATRHAAPAELLAVAERAIAKDPAQRWASITACSEVLRDWLRRLESVAITLQAERTLGTDADSGATEQSASGLRAAIALWPENPAARRDLSLANAVQAAKAIAKEDEYAASMAIDEEDPAHQAVVQELTQLHRRKQRRRSRRLVAAGILALIALGAAALILRPKPPPADVWQTTSSWTMVRGQKPAGLELTHSSPVDPLELPTPTADGLRIGANKTLWLAPSGGRSDLRLTVVASWPEKVDGFEFMVGVPRRPYSPYWFVPPGSSCQFGGWWGSRTFISINQQAGLPDPGTPVYVPFQPRLAYRFTFEMAGDDIRLLVDGREVCRQRYLIPIGGNDAHHIGIRGWSAVDIRSILVECKPAPAPGPTTAADTLANLGHEQDALDAYQAVLRSDLPAEAAQRSLARAFVIAARLPGTDRLRRDLLTRLEREHPQSPYRADLLEAESQRLWRDEHWQEAISQAEQVQRLAPERHPALALIRQSGRNVPNDQFERLLRMLAAEPAIAHLDISGRRLTSLTAIQGLQLDSLMIANNRISDLSPLRGMRLRTLTSAKNRITDLAPLKGMALQRVDLGENQVQDLAPLAGQPIESLDVGGNDISNLAPLSGMPLVSLDIARTRVASLAPLAGMNGLERLMASGCPITDLAPVAKPALSILSIDSCPISDLGVLASTGLTSLSANRTGIRDPSPLPRSTLRQLSLHGSQVSSLDWLKDFRLWFLDLGGTPITSLQGMPQCFTAGAHLLLNHTALTSIEPLRGFPIHVLSISDTRVADLSPLAECDLVRFSCERTPATDPTPLQGHARLEDVQIHGSAIPPEALNRLADGLEHARCHPQMVLQIRAQAAVSARNWSGLRFLARRIGARDRLIIGSQMTIGEARSLARAAGARLYCPVDVADLEAVRNTSLTSEPLWVGLLPNADPGLPPQWEDGRTDPDPSEWIEKVLEPYDASGYFALGKGNHTFLAVMRTANRDSGRNRLALEW